MPLAVIAKAMRSLGSPDQNSIPAEHVSACSQPYITVVEKALRRLGEPPPPEQPPPVVTEDTTPPDTTPAIENLATACPVGSLAVGVPFSVFLVATGGTEPYTWSYDGTLPTGLTLDSATGEISGTPTEAGTFGFTVHVESADGQHTSAGACSLTVETVAITSGCPIGDLVVNVPFDAFTVTGSGGETPYTWSISAGSLPTGLTIDSATGIISGTPTVAGSYSFTPHLHTADGFDVDLEGGCSLDVSGTLIGRPLTAFEFESDPPVNPARTRIIDGNLAKDNDAAIGSSLTYAESQMDSCTSTAFGLASLMLYDFPEPPITIDHAVVHVVTEYVCALHFGSPDGPFFAGTSVFWLNTANPIGINGMDGKYLDLDSNSGNVPAAKAEHTVTISGADWVDPSKFNNSASNLFVRATQYDSGNFSFDSGHPSKLRIYDCWVEYFF